MERLCLAVGWAEDKHAGEVQSSVELLWYVLMLGIFFQTKLSGRWGDGSVRCLSSEHKDLCCIPGIHVKCQVWQSTVHTCDSTLGKQREKDPWDLLAASLATSTSSTFCQRSCLRKLGRE